METGIGSSGESTLAPDFGVTYDSAVIVGGDTKELLFDEIGRQARPGDRGPHAWVIVHGQRLSPLDVFDGCLTLLTGSAGESWRAAAAVLPADLPFQVLAVGGELSDPTGELTEWYGLADNGPVLVRPDGYVAWCTSSADGDAGETLHRVIARSLGAWSNQLSRLWPRRAASQNGRISARRSECGHPRTRPE